LDLLGLQVVNKYLVLPELSELEEFAAFYRVFYHLNWYFWIEVGELDSYVFLSQLRIEFSFIKDSH
jgi:hypothetical protein